MYSQACCGPLLRKVDMPNELLIQVRDALQRLADSNGWKPFVPDPGYEADPWVPAEHQALMALEAVKAQLAVDAAPSTADYCTDPDNCRRCNTHPNHRRGMGHAGIGRYPAGDPAAPKEH